MRFRHHLPVTAIALLLSSCGVRTWPWGLPGLPSISGIVYYAIKTWAFLFKRCFFIILIGVISKFESISLDLGLSDRIDTVSVGFGKAPVRCTSPCFQLEQSVSTILWECTAASPGLLAILVIPQPAGTSPFLTKPVQLCPLWLPTPGSPTLLRTAGLWGKAFWCKPSSSGTRRGRPGSLVSLCGCRPLRQDLAVLPLSASRWCRCCLPRSAARSCCCAVSG